MTTRLPLQNSRGILLMAIGMFLFAAVDAMAKHLSTTMHPLQLVWIRNLGLLAGALFLLSRHGSPILRTARPGLQILRGLCAIVSAVAFIAALRHVPLADAVAVSFIAPFIVTIIGALVLKERVGLRRATAIAIGFLATLIIMRPGSGVMHPAIFLVVLAATVFAIRQALSRSLGRTDATATTVTYTAFTGFIVLALPLPFVWQTPASWQALLLLAAIAALAGIAEFLVIKALTVAESVAVAPVHYTILLWSTAYGFLFFDHLPDGWTLLGAAIIIVTGLYTLHRERLAQR